MPSLLPPDILAALRAAFTGLSVNARRDARRRFREALDRQATAQHVKETDLEYPNEPGGLVLGTSGRPSFIGTYTPPPAYRVFKVIRNPSASLLTRDRRLTRAALKVIRSDHGEE
jgi:hypothetical protein